MAIRVKITKDQLAPSYGVQLRDGYGRPVNLTGATVLFQLRSSVTGALKVNMAPTIVDAVSGSVRYDWVAGDTDTVGVFLAYWQVTFSDGTVLDYPSDTTDVVEVVTGPNLGYQLSGACAPWSNVESVRACCGGLTSVSGTNGYADEPTVQNSINVATDLLYTLSGQQFPGECLAVLRPCKKGSCYAGWWGMWGFGGYGSGASASTFPNPPDPSSFPPPQCGCGWLPKVDLGLWPVTNVISVYVNGELIDPSTYRLDQNRYLVRLAPDPNSPNPGWPPCQRLDLPSTEDDTWEVTVEYGTPPPPSGVNAVNKLACELAKACAGVTCQLPSRVQSVNRQQVSITMIDPSMLDNGLTGVYEVDLFIIAFNPGKSRGMSMVWSPDLEKPAWRAGR